MNVQKSAGHLSEFNGKKDRGAPGGNVWDKNYFSVKSLWKWYLTIIARCGCCS